MTRPTVLAVAATQPAARSAARTALLVALAAVAAALAVVFGPLAAAPAAWAHDTLVSSSPAEGESLDAAPTEATLMFSGEIQQVGAVFELVDDAAQPIDLPAALELDGPSVTQPLPDLGPGAYTLNWRVVSSDGHPIDGAIGFTVTGGVAVEPTGNAGAATPGQTAGLVGGEATSVPDAATQAPGPVSSAGEGFPTWAVIVIGLVGIVVVIGAIVGFLAVMRRNDELRDRAAGDAGDGQVKRGGADDGPVS